MCQVCFLAIEAIWQKFWKSQFPAPATSFLTPAHGLFFIDGLEDHTFTLYIGNTVSKTKNPDIFADLRGSVVIKISPRLKCFDLIIYWFVYPSVFGKLLESFAIVGLVQTDDRSALLQITRQLQLENTVGDKVFVSDSTLLLFLFH